MELLISLHLKAKAIISSVLATSGKTSIYFMTIRSVNIIEELMKHEMEIYLALSPEGNYHTLGEGNEELVSRITF